MRYITLRFANNKLNSTNCKLPGQICFKSIYFNKKKLRLYFSNMVVDEIINNVISFAANIDAIYKRRKLEM